MQPDLIEVPKRISSPPFGVPRYSSLYCLMGLLGTQNALTWTQISKRYSLLKGYDHSFENRNAWDFDLIRADTGLSTQVVRLSTSDAWVNASFCSQKASGQLRGCFECFAGGFHTPLYQHSFLQKCRVHLLPLVVRCPQCGRIRPYRVSALSNNGLQCTCNKEPWNLISTTDRWVSFSDAMTGFLTDYLEWLSAAKSNVMYSSPYTALGKGRCLVISAGPHVDQIAASYAALRKPVSVPAGWGARTYRTVKIVMEETRTRWSIASLNVDDDVDVIERHIEYKRRSNEHLDTPVAPIIVSLTSLQERIASVLHRLLEVAKAFHGPCMSSSGAGGRTNPSPAQDVDCPIAKVTHALITRWTTADVSDVFIDLCDLCLNTMTGKWGHQKPLAIDAAAQLTFYHVRTDIAATALELIDGDPDVASRPKAEALDAARARVAFAMSLSSAEESRHAHAAAEGLIDTAVLSMAEGPDWEDTWVKACQVNAGHNTDIARNSPMPSGGE